MTLTPSLRNPPTSSLPVLIALRVSFIFAFFLDFELVSEMRDEPRVAIGEEEGGGTTVGGGPRSTASTEGEDTE